ncbi:DUF4920 domain-containing protein [Roseivirga misakiensis]|uniref:DUF4920 domain-containing protein n=1 Tax=Roseivirga misakiensis TaxID=1563681 RepID=A0A1E5T5E7_9BACT|nr:DUF4920 domain-containing protein [Roseivirga misakiensis]OEK06568.1 hypothetical protein BFP71_02535 [Roseivirga misakiensis]
MRNLLLLALAICMFSCAGQKEEQQAEVVGTYGEEINNKGVITVAEMEQQLAKADTVFVKVKGEITATCAMKGCWMNLVLADGEEMRVTFKDYGFFVPKEGMEGNEALIDGMVTRTVTDVETLKHYAKDAGKSEEVIAAITEDKEELAFVANGVIIYKTEVAPQ